MKSNILFVFLFWSTAACSQEPGEQKADFGFSRILIGVHFSPDACYRTLINNDGSNMSSTIIDIRNKEEDIKLSYSAGISACYNFSKHIGIEIGVDYAIKGFANKVTDFIYGNMVNPRYGFVYGASGPPPTEVKLLYNFNYIDVPVRTIITFGKKRIRFLTSVGITANFLLKATLKSIIKYEDGDKKRETLKQQNEFNKLNITPTISIGADYRISNKLNLKVEPTFRYSLLKICETPVSAYLWTGGLNISCCYRFK